MLRYWIDSQWQFVIGRHWRRMLPPQPHSSHSLARFFSPSLFESFWSVAAGHRERRAAVRPRVPAPAPTHR